MFDTVGFLELNSIARGIEVADRVLKAADVSLVYAKPSCPGKYMILLTGAVESVATSLRTGVSAGGEFIVDSTYIPRVHPEVVRALSGMAEAGGLNALGVMEFFSVTWAIQGADAAVKASNIKLLEIRPGMGIGGKSFVTLTGEVSAVETSVAAGTRQAAAEGMLLNKTVIPRPQHALLEQLL